MRTLAITLVFAVLFSSKCYLNTLPTGVVFTVKIQNLDNELINELDYKLVRSNENSLEIGTFRDYILAQKAKSDAKHLGFVEAKIVSYFNRNEVTLQDALTLLDNQNYRDQRGERMLSDYEIDLALETMEKPTFYYTVQIGIFNSQQADIFLDLPKSVDELITEKGNFRYNYGRYYTVNDARDALRLIKESGLNGAFITAYDEVERIPLARAMDMEQKYLLDAVATIE